MSIGEIVKDVKNKKARSSAQKSAVALGGEIPENYTNRGDRLLADIARAKYQRWKESYRPIENSYIDRVLGFNTTASRNAIVGQGVASAEQGIPGPTGVRPYSPGGGRFINERVMAALARGRSRSASAVEGNSAVADRSLAARGGLVRLGQGLSEQGSTSIAQAAAIRRSADAAEARSDAVLRSAKQDAIGSVIGAGVGYYTGRASPSPTKLGPPNIGETVAIGPDGWPI